MSKGCFLEEIEMKYFGSWKNRLGHSRLGMRQSRSQEMACGSITKAAELSVFSMGAPPFWAKSDILNSDFHSPLKDGLVLAIFLSTDNARVQGIPASPQ